MSVVFIAGNYKLIFEMSELRQKEWLWLTVWRGHSGHVSRDHTLSWAPASRTSPRDVLQAWTGISFSMHQGDKLWVEMPSWGRMLLGSMGVFFFFPICFLLVHCFCYWLFWCSMNIIYSWLLNSTVCITWYMCVTVICGFSSVVNTIVLYYQQLVHATGSRTTVGRICELRM